MEPGILDHLFAILVIVLLPIKGLRDHDRLVQQLRDGDSGARKRLYGRIMLEEWLLFAGVVVLWAATARAFDHLGFGWAIGWPAWIGWTLALAAVAFSTLQNVLLLRKPDQLDSLRGELEPVREMIPHDTAESRLFAAVSVTAGVCEETLYRGFLLVYFDSLLGIWGALLLSSIAFGLGHAYQGTRGILKTGSIGLAMAVLCVLTGSLWAPMLVHAVIDLNSGTLARRAVRRWETRATAA